MPNDLHHEDLSRSVIEGPQLRPVWEHMQAFSLRATDVARVAVGPRFAADDEFSPAETLLADIIGGDAFGVDRIDYLLRDSHHAGVAYGRFDHNRLIETLRILPKSYAYESAEEVGVELALGVEQGGLHAAEGLLLARYFMFTQLYFHRVRRAYDFHLKQFLAAWLDGGRFPIEPDAFLRLTDVEVAAAIHRTADDTAADGHDAARRITERRHFRVAYEGTPADRAMHPRPGRAVAAAIKEQFGADNVHHDEYSERAVPIDFPVLMEDGSLKPARMVSTVLRTLPQVTVDYVFVAPEIRDEATRWLRPRLAGLLSDASAQTDIGEAQ